VFITLEGIDRSGKTTQAAMLADALGPRTLLVREPGGTEAGERIRAMLTDPDLALGPGAEVLLFCAARAELATQVIAPARREGRDVICDRYVDSTAAYQGAAVGALYAGTPGFEGREPRDIGIDLIEQLNALIVRDCMPDLTILVRIDADGAAGRGRRRLEAGGEDGDDRFEARGIDFQREVAAAYDDLALRHPARIAVVEGDGTPAEVHARVLALVEERL
jgi:dTMP kinase